MLQEKLPLCSSIVVALIVIIIVKLYFEAKARRYPYVCRHATILWGKSVFFQ